jgi:hypothetical protein
MSRFKDYLSGSMDLNEYLAPGSAESDVHMTVRSEAAKREWREWLTHFEASMLDLSQISPDTYKQVIDCADGIRNTTDKHPAGAESSVKQMTDFLTGIQESSPELKELLGHWTELLAWYDYIRKELLPDTPQPPGTPMMTREDYFDKLNKTKKTEESKSKGDGSEWRTHLGDNYYLDHQNTRVYHGAKHIGSVGRDKDFLRARRYRNWSTGDEKWGEPKHLTAKGAAMNLVKAHKEKSLQGDVGESMMGGRMQAKAWVFGDGHVHDFDPGESHYYQSTDNPHIAKKFGHTEDETSKASGGYNGGYDDKISMAVRGGSATRVGIHQGHGYVNGMVTPHVKKWMSQHKDSLTAVKVDSGNGHSEMYPVDRFFGGDTKKKLSKAQMYHESYESMLGDIIEESGAVVTAINHQADELEEDNYLPFEVNEDLSEFHPTKTQVKDRASYILKIGGPIQEAFEYLAPYVCLHEFCGKTPHELKTEIRDDGACRFAWMEEDGKWATPWVNRDGDDIVVLDEGVGYSGLLEDLFAEATGGHKPKNPAGDVQGGYKKRTPKALQKREVDPEKRRDDFKSRMKTEKPINKPSMPNTPRHRAKTAQLDTPEAPVTPDVSGAAAPSTVKQHQNQAGHGTKDPTDRGEHALAVSNVHTSSDPHGLAKPGTNVPAKQSNLPAVSPRSIQKRDPKDVKSYRRPARGPEQIGRIKDAEFTIKDPKSSFKSKHDKSATWTHDVGDKPGARADDAGNADAEIKDKQKVAADKQKSPGGPGGITMRTGYGQKVHLQPGVYSMLQTYSTSRAIGQKAKSLYKNIDQGPYEASDADIGSTTGTVHDAAIADLLAASVIPADEVEEEVTEKRLSTALMTRYASNKGFKIKDVCDCGCVLPKYPGRYPEKCPGCGVDGPIQGDWEKVVEAAQIAHARMSLPALPWSTSGHIVDPLDVTPEMASYVVYHPVRCESVGIVHLPMENLAENLTAVIKETIIELTMLAEPRNPGVQSLMPGSSITVGDEDGESEERTQVGEMEGGGSLPGAERVPGGDPGDTPAPQILDPMDAIEDDLDEAVATIMAEYKANIGGKDARPVKAHELKAGDVYHNHARPSDSPKTVKSIEKSKSTPGNLHVTMNDGDKDYHASFRHGEEVHVLEGANDDATLIVKTNKAGAEALVPLLTHIKKAGDPGHSFSIVVDPDCSDYRETFGWDGDGSDRIKDIQVSEKVKPLPKDEADPDELEKGTEVEMEHTDDKEKASRIAREHLGEDPEYYTKLNKVMPDEVKEGMTGHEFISPDGGRRMHVRHPDGSTKYYLRGRNGEYSHVPMGDKDTPKGDKMYWHHPKVKSLIQQHYSHLDEVHGGSDGVGFHHQDQDMNLLGSNRTTSSLPTVPPKEQGAPEKDIDEMSTDNDMAAHTDNPEFAPPVVTNDVNTLLATDVKPAHISDEDTP